MYLIQCIRFGSWKVQSLNRAIVTTKYQGTFCSPSCLPHWIRWEQSEARVAYFFSFVSIVNYIVMWDLVKKYFKKWFLKLCCGNIIYCIRLLHHLKSNIKTDIHIMERNITVTSLNIASICRCTRKRVEYFCPSAWKQWLNNNCSILLAYCSILLDVRLEGRNKKNSFLGWVITVKEWSGFRDVVAFFQ